MSDRPSHTLSRRRFFAIQCAVRALRLCDAVAFEAESSREQRRRRREEAALARLAWLDAPDLQAASHGPHQFTLGTRECCGLCLCRAPRPAMRLHASSARSPAPAVGSSSSKQAAAAIGVKQSPPHQPNGHRLGIRLSCSSPGFALLYPFLATCLQHTYSLSLLEHAQR